MKKITLFLLVLLTSMGLQAEDLTGLKIYLNPGHGGYDSNDRSIWTIPVPETWTNPGGYWESKSNLVKALALRDLLEAAGATVFMSRTENTSGMRDTTYYQSSPGVYKPGVDVPALLAGGDRDLSEIAREANDNNVDHFLSIHSNALNGATNYLLMLYRGVTEGNPTTPASLPMAQSCFNILITNPLTVWSSTSVNVRADVPFYPPADNGLGVLRPLTVPGFLSEGSFHDYPPETHRLSSNDYCKLEAIRFFQHFHSYFKRDLPVNGTIAGWVKSKNEPIVVKNFTYRGGSDDQWLPLNGAKVELLDASGGTVLQEYTTDGWYNGIYAFYDLAPGNYKVRASLAGHESETTDVTLAASQIAYAKMRLYNPNYINPDTEVDYPNPDQEAGTMALSNYDFEAEGEPVDPDWLNDHDIKRILYRNEKLYVLTTDPKILVVNAKTTELIKELNITGTEKLSDIAFTADNFLLACNKETINFAAPTTYFKVWTWDDDNAAPTLLFQSTKAGNFNDGIIGETFAASGPRRNCKLYTTAVSTAPSHWRIVGFQYKADVGDVVASTFMGAATAPAPNYYLYEDWGQHPIFTITPNGNGDHLYIDSEVMLPVEYQFDWSAAERAPLVEIGSFAEVSGYEIPAISRGGNFFRNAGHSYWMAPVCEADGANVGVVLFDINDGLDKAVKVSEKYPEEGLGETPADYMVAAGLVTGYDIDIMVLAKNQGMARYKTPDIPTANIYASELSITPENAFRFTLNENAQAVVITIFKEGETLTAHNAGAMTKGVHTVDNPFSMEFDSWGVTATARPVVRPIKLSNDDPVFQFYTVRGVAIDNTPASPYFGRIYVTEPYGGKISEGVPSGTGRTTQRGVYILNAACEDVTGQGSDSYSGGITWGLYDITNFPYNFGPTRPAVAPDGKLYMSDGTFNNSGVYVMDPANPSADFKSVFGGTRNTTNGAVTENSVTIHNSIQNCQVMGTGANTQLFILDRIASTSPITGKLQRFDIGELDAPWTVAPSTTVFSDPNNRLQNGYGTIAYDSHGGWWISQYRAGAGGTAVPGLIHVTNGVEDYNVGSDWPSTYQGVTAVNADGSVLALATANGKAQIFDVAYDAGNKPVLTPKYEIVWSGSGSLQDAAFDVAGNLYLVSNANERLMIYSLPKAENTYTTRVSQSGGVGIKTVKSSEVKVYPNPAVSDLFINGNGTRIDAYTLYDLNGRTIRTGMVHAVQATVPVSDLSAGVYVLQIRTAEEVVVKRIMKR